MRLILLTVFLVPCLAFALDARLSNKIGDRCYYSDGTVVDLGGRGLCPKSLKVRSHNDVSLVPSEAMQLESLRLGRQASDMMSNGMSGLIKSLDQKNKQRKYSNVLESHPNAQSTLRDPKFLTWASNDDDLYRLLLKAHNGDAKSLDTLLTLHKLTALSSQSDFRSWVTSKYSEDTFKTQLEKAYRTGNWTWIKGMMGDWTKSESIWPKQTAGDSSQKYETYGFEYSEPQSNSKVTLDESIVKWNVDKQLGEVKSTDSERDLTTTNTGNEQPSLNESYTAPKISIGECVLGNSGAYLVMEWTNRDKLGKFRRKFATIANLKAKAEAALIKSGQFSKNFKDKNKRYLKNIQQLQEHAVAFRNYAITQGRNNDVALLDQLIDCRE